MDRLRNFRTGSWVAASVGLVVAGMMATAAVTAGQATTQQGQVTFTKDIAPILQRSCENCHRTNGVGPMPLSTFEHVRPWAKAIKQRTATREMPPWYIEKNIGIQRFKDDPSLSDAEIAKIGAWVDSGMARGNPADMPPARQYEAAGSWAGEIGTPDLIVSTDSFVVKAVAPDWHGDVPAVVTGLNEDRYIAAVQVKETWVNGEADRFKAGVGPFNPFILHHAIVSPQPIEDSSGEGAGRAAPGTFQIVFELGQNPLVYPKDAAVLLPKNSKLNFALHLHSIGRDVPARVDVGFKLHPKGYAPKYKGLTNAPMGWMHDEMDIPAGQDNVRFDGFYTMPQSGRLMTYEPHMHATGTRFCMEAIYPNGLREMLNCSGYNHNWVKVYTYEEDVAPLLPKGTVIHTIGWYDNSAKNPRSLEPRNWKGYGNRTIDDMFIALNRMLFLTEDEFKEQVAEREAKQRLTQTGAPKTGGN